MWLSARYYAQHVSRSHLKPQAFFARELRYRASRAKASPQDRDMARGLNRVAQRSHDILVVELQIRCISNVLGERLPCDCELRSIDEVRILQEIL